MILLSPGGASTAAAQKGDCKQEVLQAYQKITEKYTTLTQRKKPLSFAMRVDTYSRAANPAKPTLTTQRVDMVMQDNRLYYSDGSTEMYQSPGELVAIAKDKRLIYISNATYSDQQRMVPAIGLLRDGLIREATVQRCERVTQQGKTYRKVRLLPKQAFRERFKTTYLELLLDEQAIEIAQYTITYDPTSSVASVKYTMLSSASATKQPHLLTSPFSYVLGSGNTLRAQFAGYQLVDQRKR